ncbi:MAG: hypothetical protein CMJ31_14210 [Phycisphaerae bacterium]|nr:hypothetical protein [Phycisphaerae bacterium]
MTTDANATPEQRLDAAGFTLPEAPAAVAMYVPVVVDRGAVIVSGQIPLADGRLFARGVVGDSITLETATDCARRCALNALAVARSAVGSLDRIERVVRIGVFVAATPDFADHPKVANGASEVFFTAFGEAGRHARAAVGCSSLPLGAPVEVEAMFRLRDDDA